MAGARLSQGSFFYFSDISNKGLLFKDETTNFIEFSLFGPMPASKAMKNEPSFTKQPFKDGEDSPMASPTVSFAPM